jgi:hypothetical protein
MVNQQKLIVFFIESIINSIPELTNNSIEQNITDDKGIEKAPPIIYLDDNEKFKDECDNVLEIETRGVRNEDNIYFKVKDIEKQFDMPNLKRVIIDDTKSYELNIDYKFFLCEKYLLHNNKIKIKKDLFLTIRGIHKCIEVSRNKFNYNIKSILQKWIAQNFNNIQLDTFVIEKNNLIKSYEGYVYCMSSPLINSIKIGFWTKSINGLKARYKTYYGNNIELFFIFTKNAYKLEQKCHRHFNHYCICNELFDKIYIDKYKTFLLLNKE